MTDAEWGESAVVGRVARAHGNRGQVIVNPETDFVEARFQAGAELFALRAGRVECLRVTTMRVHLGRPIIGIAGVETMTDAESMAGLELRVPVASLETLPEGTYYRHDLVGCRVETIAGDTLGAVVAVEGELGASRLVVEGGPAGEVLVPLAQAICRVIDVAGRRILIDPPDGLLELNRRP